jgi:hypothetical protein
LATLALVVPHNEFASFDFLLDENMISLFSILTSIKLLVLTESSPILPFAKIVLSD